MWHRKLPSHRTLGRLSLLITPLFVASGLVVVHTMITGATGFNRAYGARLAFVDLTTIAYFVAAYVLAIANRRNVQLRARYLGSTAILVLAPALARALAGIVPGIDSFDAAFHGSMVLTELIVVALIANDVRIDRLRYPYVCLLMLTLLPHASFIVIPHVAWWNALVAR